MSYKPKQTDGRRFPRLVMLEAWYDMAEDAFYRGDGETIARGYTEDAELFVVDGPVVRGKAAIAEYCKQVLAAGGNKLNVETWEVQETDDWAYETGRFTATTPSERSLFVGKYLVIWKRDAGEPGRLTEIFRIGKSLPAAD